MSKLRKRRGNWGGARQGAGRPRQEEQRRNRVVLLLTDSEFKLLREHAASRPLGPVAREVLTWSLRRRK
jgi:hypothetical protein